MAIDIGKSIESINMKFLVDDSLGLGFLKMPLVLVYHKNCCLGCIVIGGRFFGAPRKSRPNNTHIAVLVSYFILEACYNKWFFIPKTLCQCMNEFSQHPKITVLKKYFQSCNFVKLTPIDTAVVPKVKLLNPFSSFIGD